MVSEGTIYVATCLGQGWILAIVVYHLSSSPPHSCCQHHWPSCIISRPRLTTFAFDNTPD